MTAKEMGRPAFLALRTLIQIHRRTPRTPQLWGTSSGRREETWTVSHSSTVCMRCIGECGRAMPGLFRHIWQQDSYKIAAGLMNMLELQAI
jgi:hypothetical protein